MFPNAITILVLIITLSSCASTRPKRPPSQISPPHISGYTDTPAFQRLVEQMETCRRTASSRERKQADDAAEVALSALRKPSGSRKDYLEASYYAIAGFWCAENFTGLARTLVAYADCPAPFPTEFSPRFADQAYSEAARFADAAGNPDLAQHARARRRLASPTRTPMIPRNPTPTPTTAAPADIQFVLTSFDPGRQAILEITDDPRLNILLLRDVPGRPLGIRAPVKSVFCEEHRGASPEGKLDLNEQRVYLRLPNCAQIQAYPPAALSR